jgi:hypothetical protein
LICVEEAVTMTRRWLATLLVLLVLALSGSAPLALEAVGPPVTPVPLAAVAGPEPPRREAATPDISLIDSPSPTCYRLVENTGACYIQWSYLQVTATSPEYIVTMTVTIDGSLRAYHGGFFQTSMLIPGQVYGPGFEVTCGFPGAGGLAEMGKTYNYAIRARETGGLAAANYGSVTCPADVIDVFVPLIPRGLASSGTP